MSRTQVRSAFSKQDKCELAHPFLQSSYSLSFASFMSASTSSGERLKFSMENAYTVTQCIFMSRQTSSSCKVHNIQFCHRACLEERLTRLSVWKPSEWPWTTFMCRSRA